MNADRLNDLLGTATPLNQGEKCENCGGRPVTHYDVEGVPICESCWNHPEMWNTKPDAEAQKGKAT